MGTVKYTARLNTSQLHELLNSSKGPVAKNLVKRAVRVESAAKRRISSNPKRVDTGRLRSSITWEIRIYGNMPIARIGTNVKYAKFVHDGTGIFGPYSTVIRPKHAKAMKWKSKQYGAKKGKYKGYAFAKYTIGMKPNPFLTDALKAAKL